MSILARTPRKVALRILVSVGASSGASNMALPISFPPKALLKQSFVKVFHLGQRLGLDILPRHFYSEIPSIPKLRTTEHWRLPYSMAGVQGMDPESQLAFVRGVVTADVQQYLEQHDVSAEAARDNGELGYGPIESQLLFAVVATRRPRQIVQIGCGVSTALCISAGKFAGYRPEIACVDPYPTDFLKSAAQKGDINLIERPVETIGLDFFSCLREGDLFFVDSTHTLGPAGEVTRIIVEMLPRLSTGVFVHFHDILFPYDYAPAILSDTMFFQHESPLLHAFLCMNSNFRVCASMSWLHHRRQVELAAIFPRYRPMNMTHGLGVDGDLPSSIYLQVLGAPAAA